MRAVVYDKRCQFGLRFDDNAPKPQTKAGHVLVQTKACGLNPVDLKLQELWGVCHFLQRKVAGIDVAGTVLSAPEGSALKPGDAVWGFASGAFAQQVLCPIQEVIAKPPNVSFAEAASLPVAAITALQCFKRNNLTAGEHALVIGASGGVGTCAVQIAKALGATVTGVCGSDNVELVKSLGADSVLDYKTQDLSKHEGCYDLILDTVTSTDPRDTDYEALLRARCLRPGSGRYVAINSRHPTDFVRSMLGRAVGANLQRAGYDLVVAEHRQEDLQQVNAWIGEGKLRPVLHGGGTFPFSYEGVHEALTLLKSRRAKGKVVLDVDGGGLK